MTRFLTALALILATVFHCMGTDKEKPRVVIEARVVRIEPWGIARTPCGVVLNYRMAEYRVDTVYEGSIRSGELVIVRYLACNDSELDELKIGDNVIVVAEALPHPQEGLWGSTSMTSVEKVAVRYGGLKLARVIYSNSDEP